MDPVTEAQASFGLRLAADLLVALVIKGAFSREEAAALVKDALADREENEPHLAELHREIAATLNASVLLLSIDVEARLKRRDQEKPNE